MHSRPRPIVALRDVELVLHERDLRDPRADHRAVDEEDAERWRARGVMRGPRSTPAAERSPPQVVVAVGDEVRDVGQVGDDDPRAAVPSLSAVASAITSPADSTIARLTSASSWSSVVTPELGVQAADAEHADVGAHAAQGVDGRGADRDLRAP